MLETTERVAELVEAVTENKRESDPPEETWWTRKQETIEALKSQKDLAVKMIVLGDKLSNIRAFHRDQLAVGDRLWERFNQKDPRAHAWYYEAIVKSTTELQHYPVWQEFSLLVEKVFGNRELSREGN